MKMVFLVSICSAESISTLLVLFAPMLADRDYEFLICLPACLLCVDVCELFLLGFIRCFAMLAGWRLSLNLSVIPQLICHERSSHSTHACRRLSVVAGTIL